MVEDRIRLANIECADRLGEIAWLFSLRQELIINNDRAIKQAEGNRLRE